MFIHVRPVITPAAWYRILDMNIYCLYGNFGRVCVAANVVVSGQRVQLRGGGRLERHDVRRSAEKLRTSAPPSRPGGTYLRRAESVTEF